MNCEQTRLPAQPGAEDVTDGSVDSYPMDWDEAENGVAEEEMQKCRSASPCGGEAAACPGNSPEQTDTQAYEIIEE